MYGNFFLTISFALLAYVSARAAGGSFAPNYSRLVHPGPDGRLTYAPDERGNIIPDFSHAGYKGGGVRLPNVKVRAVVKPGGGNDSGRIQAAIKRVSSLPPDKNGFRGAVLLKRGRYELDKPLQITAGGVILRGEGRGDDGTFLFGRGAITGLSVPELHTTANLIVIRGGRGPDLDEGAARKIADDYVPVGARSFRVERSEGLKRGDTVIVRRHGNLD